jgi:hypothetical protein
LLLGTIAAPIAWCLIPRAKYADQALLMVEPE